MRNILLIYQNPAAWNGLSREDQDAFIHAGGDIVEELSATGEWVGGEGLADASQARSTRVRGAACLGPSLGHSSDHQDPHPQSTRAHGIRR